MSAAAIAKIHHDVPGSKVVGYWDFHDIPFRVGCSTGHVMGDRPNRNCALYPCGWGTWNDAIQSSGFQSSWAVNKLIPGKPSEVICLYPGLAAYFWFKESADVLANLLSSWLKTTGLDGWYLDGTLNDYIFSEVLYSSPLVNMTVDTDGDGEAETMDEIIAQWAAWAPYFTHQLRAAIGPSKILIGNAAGALSDSALNGLTIEMESCLDADPCLQALQAQTAVGVAPPVSVLWLTHAEVMPPDQQCARAAAFQKQLPYLLAGTDFFDGSHVVCNSTV